MRGCIVCLFALLTVVTTAQIEEISFSSDTLTLAGSLYLPDGEGPFPAAVLVHGSGPVDRYQTINMGNEYTNPNNACVYNGLQNKTLENFRDIAEHLYENGIAVLTYDKRSFTYGNQLDSIRTSPKDFITDVESAIDYLSVHPKISTENIFLVGHSQGSAFIPIAAKNKSIAGLISLSGAVTPIDSLFTEQFRELYLQCADDTSNAGIVTRRLYRQFDRLRNNELVDTIPLMIGIPDGDPNDPFLFGFPIFWRDWIEISEQVIANYTAANLPILLIHGEDDFNVPLNDAFRFENGLPANLLTTVEIFEGVNHLLTTATNPKVSPQVLTSISSWINEISTVKTAIEENHVAEHFHIQYNNGILQIQALHNFSSTFNNFSLLITAMDGRIVHQAELKHKVNYRLPLNTAHNMLVLTLFDGQKMYSKVVQAN